MGTDGENWLKGHQRPWVFERVLLVGNGTFSTGISNQLVESMYTVENTHTAVEALRRVMQGEFEAVLCQVTSNFPVEMFYRGIERVRPYLTRRLIFFIDAHTEAPVVNFIRKTKALSIWYPCESHILNETITSVIRKTTSLAGLSAASNVQMIKMRQS